MGPFERPERAWIQAGDKRLVKMVQGRSLYIDFLTEDADMRGSGRQIDGITASLCPGIDRALQKRRWVEVEGKDVYGSQRTLKVPIADVGPLLVLKLNAFEGQSIRRMHTTFCSP